MDRLVFTFGVVLGCGACGAKGPPEPAPPPPPAAPGDIATAAGPDAAAAPVAQADVPDAASAAPAAAPAQAPASADAVAPASEEGASADAAGVAYMESVQILYKQQRDALTKACWAHSKSTEHAYAGKAIIRVGPGGKILSVKTTGTDDPASACLDKQIKKWKFPPPSGTATVTLPIRLHRD